MKYYVYYDAYGQPRAAVDEVELARRYGSDPQRFLQAAGGGRGQAPAAHVAGHVGTLCFDSRAEFEKFVNSLGDEITGFFEAEGGTRPYNF